MSNFDYKYRPLQPLTIFDEMFTPIRTTTKNLEEMMIKAPLYKGQKSSDGSAYILAIEIPRLIPETVSVEIIENLKSTSPFKRTGYPSYNIIIKAAQNLIDYYLFDTTEESAKRKYEEQCDLEGQNVDLDGDLTLSYSEGVLVIKIPLKKVCERKVQSLKAKL